MFAACTYEEIEQIEKEKEGQELVVLLFVRPTNSDAMDIIKEFEYIHYNSGEYCSIYAVGYTNNMDKEHDPAYRKIDTVINLDWYFSHKAFVEFKSRLEMQIKWKYSGENEVLILQNKPGSSHPLNFQNYVAIDINKGIREGYVDSFQLFMESLIRSARENVTAKEAIKGVAKDRLSIKGIVSDAIGESKRIPQPVKKIMKDRLFYRCAGYCPEERYE